MRGLRASIRVALAVSVLTLVLLAAGATAAGYLIEAGNQSSDRASRLAAAAAYGGPTTIVKTTMNAPKTRQ